MSTNIALSGINTSALNLKIISNNIANAGTAGFKQTNANFADIYPAVSGGNTAGSGVLLASAPQEFSQGDMEFTNSVLDLAINGRGFFATRPDTTATSVPSYTRAGAFQLNAAGYVVNSNGQYLQTFPVNANGTVTSNSSTVALQLPSTGGTPAATTQVELGANLPSTSTAIDLTATPFNPTDPATYSSVTSSQIYDSQGGSHTMNYYFAKESANANTWRVYPVLNTVDGNGAPIQVPMQDSANGNSPYMSLVFENSGQLDQAATATANGGNTTPGFSVVSGSIYDSAGAITTTTATIPANGGSLGDVTGAISLDLYNNTPTQFATPFNVTTLSQNGYSSGQLTGIDISDDGIFRANYSNGQQSALGKVALAIFPNEQGLNQLGNSAWTESMKSGGALLGQAKTGSFGSVRSKALESSNVNLTGQLVQLITAQRNFQANAKSLETLNAVTQNIINIR